jgi:hypothetical protein
MDSANFLPTVSRADWAKLSPRTGQRVFQRDHGRRIGQRDKPTAIRNEADQIIRH